jgi:hypothetical protein
MKGLSFILLLQLINSFVFAQEENQKTKKPIIIGIQANPYWKSADEKGWALALRYAVDLHKHFTLGFELSGNIYDNSGYNNKKAGISLLGRYNITETRKLLWFAELDVSAWYAYWDYKEMNDKYTKNYPYYTSDTNYQLFNWFFAPGVRIPFAKDKLSIDLMLKMSSEPVIFDSWKIAPSFRFNIHF